MKPYEIDFLKRRLTEIEDLVTSHGDVWYYRNKARDLLIATRRALGRIRPPAPPRPRTYTAAEKRLLADAQAFSYHPVLTVEGRCRSHTKDEEGLRVRCSQKRGHKGRHQNRAVVPAFVWDNVKKRTAK